MLMQMVSIYDGKAEAWSNPMYFRAAGEAIRSFQQAANDPQNDVSFSPADYTMFLLGTFNPSTGEIEACAPLEIARAMNLVTQELKVG